MACELELLLVVELVELFVDIIAIMTPKTIINTKKPTTDSTPILMILHSRLGFFTLAN